MNLPRIIAITGGIGAGKSVVSHIVSSLGYEVYDCDSQAKVLMDSDEAIKHRLKEEIHHDAVKADGSIDRALISSIVFVDSEMLARLNAIVHEAVRNDIVRWQGERHRRDTIFVETAILYQSGLDRMVDEVWEVIAPEEIRIMRVMQRNSCSRDDVAARIASQQFTPTTPHSRVREIVNDGFTAVLPQVLDALV